LEAPGFVYARVNGRHQQRKSDMTTKKSAAQSRKTSTSLKGSISESWICIDCKVNTAPGLMTRVETEKAFAAGKKSVPMRVGDDSEIFIVRDKVWTASKVAPWGGCLCIGCLETRIGRRLRPKDFLRNHPLNQLPGTARLLERRWGPPQEFKVGDVISIDGYRTEDGKHLWFVHPDGMTEPKPSPRKNTMDHSSRKRRRRRTSGSYLVPSPMHDAKQLLGGARRIRTRVRGFGIMKRKQNATPIAI
jgi:hypothetical protein